MHAAILALLIAQAVPPPPLPDSSGWGVHVLAIARAPDSAIWVGTYGQGIFVLRKGAGTWERVRSSSDTAAHAISWDFVHAFAFGPKGQIWYGTVGNGWGVSMGGGKTWKNWEFRQLGPEWQYVTPDGIVTRGDTTYIATADGVKLTWDDGQTWRVITDSLGATTAKDSVWATIGNQYAQSLVGGSELRLTHLRGRERSRDGGRTWSAVAEGNTDRPSVDSLPGLTVGAPGLVTQGRIVTSLHPRAPPGSAAPSRSRISRTSTRPTALAPRWAATSSPTRASSSTIPTARPCMPSATGSSCTRGRPRPAH